MCPMLWCRDTFEAQLETINHIPTCRWLSDTWYWCPSCSRPETFMDCGGTGGQVPLQRKESRVKRAMTFFKHFGRRISTQGKIAWPSSPARAFELADNSRYAFQDAKAMDHKDPTEMECVASSALVHPEPICYLQQNRHCVWTEMVTSIPHMITEMGPSGAEDKTSEYDMSSYASLHDAFSSDEEPAMMQPLIEELRELVFIVNTEWLRRLAPYEDLSVLCSSFSVRDLFEVGIKALKECFDGVIVTSFIDVFALMHVACAYAYMLHRDDESYCWDNLLDDMLVWQYAIVNESEVLLFVEVMNKLSIPQGILNLSSKASNLYNWSSRGA